MAKIVTLGEIMLRLSPMGNDRFIQSESFRIIPGGGEANVAVSVANYGHEAYFVSKLPKHEIGQIAVNALRRYGVNTQYIARGGDRVGHWLSSCQTPQQDVAATKGRLIRGQATNLSTGAI